MLSCEESGQSGYLEPYQDSVVSMTQNCVVVGNILGRTCVFLSKGMAKSRQAVRKSQQTRFLPLLLLEKTEIFCYQKHLEENEDILSDILLSVCVLGGRGQNAKRENFGVPHF